MIDERYKSAFKEVYDILANTDEELVKKIPDKFMNFIKDNMNSEYQTNIKKDVDIDKQDLMKETESILALIYRSYWITEEEKAEFTELDRNRMQELQSKKEKNIQEVFEKREDINKVTIDNNLIVIEKENIIKRILNKILKFFRKK